MARANKERASQRHLAFKSQTIVRSLLMENSYANVGRLDVARQRLSQGNDAWLGIISAGRRDAINHIRAMNALTDSSNRHPFSSEGNGFHLAADRFRNLLRIGRTLFRIKAFGIQCACHRSQCKQAHTKGADVGIRCFRFTTIVAAGVHVAFHSALLCAPRPAVWNMFPSTGKTHAQEVGRSDGTSAVA